MRNISTSTTLRQRIMTICDFLELSANQLSEKAGKGRNYICNLKDYVGSDFLVYIWSNYPQININWILTGRGRMLLHDEDTFIDRDELMEQLKEQQIEISLLQETNRQLQKKLAFYERNKTIKLG